MTRSLVCGTSQQPEDDVFSCAKGQLIGMADWAFPSPAPAAGAEVPCPRR